MIRYFSCGEYLLHHSHKHQVNNCLHLPALMSLFMINVIFAEQNILYTATFKEIPTHHDEAQRF